MFAGAHLLNGWVFQQFELSVHISWVYLPAFLRVAYVLVLGPVWGFSTIFLGSLLLSSDFDELLLHNITNSVASALGPVLALGLFRLLKERALQLSRMSDLVQMCLLYALLNALLHHVAWSYNQPHQFLSPNQLPIMVIGDLTGAVLGALLFTAIMRRLRLYDVVARLSQDDRPT
jgi:Na+-translocating ferredoxin:NAD+ oxidoreductase RnfA subunit